MGATLHVILANIQFLCHFYKKAFRHSPFFLDVEVTVVLQVWCIFGILFLCPFFVGHNILNVLGSPILRFIVFICFLTISSLMAFGFHFVCFNIILTRANASALKMIYSVLFRLNKFEIMFKFPLTTSNSIFFMGRPFKIPMHLLRLDDFTLPQYTFSAVRALDLSFLFTIHIFFELQ